MHSPPRSPESTVTDSEPLTRANATMGDAFICPNTGCPFKRLFSCLDAAQADSLGRARMGRHYDAGETVFHSETLALAVYCIHAGHVRLSWPTRGGEPIVVGVRGAGDVLGFREAIAETPYQVSAEAIAPSMVCAVPRETFLGVVERNPELALRLMKRRAREYRGAETELVMRAYLDVPSRIAHLLSAQASEGLLVDGWKQQAVGRRGRGGRALLVGPTREPLSRNLSKLALRGIIQLADGAIHVLDLQALQALAG